MDATNFWARVATGDGCWEWLGTRHGHGYGLLRIDGRLVRAHRVAWELENGPIPAGLSVLHSCDNRPCVRPDHLRLGTQRDNMADMDERRRRFTPFAGQVQAGEQNRNAHLTAEQVGHIRGMAAAGHYQDDIAARFGVNQATVSLIVSGKTWVGIEPVVYPPAVRDRPVGRNAKRIKASG